MSTRYVYGVYDTTASIRQADSVSLATSDFYKEISGYLCNKFSLTVAENRNGDPVTFYSAESDASVGATNSLFNQAAGGTQYSCEETVKYKYAVLTVGSGWVNGKPIVDKSVLVELPSTNFGAYWHSKYFQGSADVWTSNSSNRNQELESADKKTIYVSGGNLAQGSTLLRTESSGTALQTGALTYGDSFRWRSLKGSDTIDPAAVTYSVADIYSEEQFSVNAVPVTPKYGGTVYYLFQYSTDGGSTWTSIGSKTTATSVSVTLPEGVERFQARVLASDGWGFASTTYVYGPAKEVSQLKAYVGIGAKAVALKKGYVGIGGKAKELVKGYVGVGGVARKLF